MPNVVVVEDDYFLRVAQLVLDPNASRERYAAFADFFAHDQPDFDGWCEKVRRQAGKLYPAGVRLVETQDELRKNLADADALIVEGLAVGADEIAAAPHLKEITAFSPFNLVYGSPPEHQFDAVFCRNVLIYFSGRARRIALDKLTRAVHPGGYLILGPTDTLSDTALFDAVWGQEAVIYRRRQNG